MSFNNSLLQENVTVIWLTGTVLHEMIIYLYSARFLLE